MILGQVALTLRRCTGGSRVDGRFVATWAADATIYGSVQPTPGRELERLPEGERSRDSRTLYTETEVRSADQATSTLADRIVSGGIVYEVYQAKPWPAGGPLPHYEALLLRLAETGGAV